MTEYCESEFFTCKLSSAASATRCDLRRRQPCTAGNLGALASVIMAVRARAGDGPLELIAPADDFFLLRDLQVIGCALAGFLVDPAGTELDVVDVELWGGPLALAVLPPTALARPLARMPQVLHALLRCDGPPRWDPWFAAATQIRGFLAAERCAALAPARHESPDPTRENGASSPPDPLIAALTAALGGADMRLWLTQGEFGLFVIDRAQARPTRVGPAPVWSGPPVCVITASLTSALAKSGTRALRSIFLQGGGVLERLARACAPLGVSLRELGALAEEGWSAALRLDRDEELLVACVALVPA